MKHKMPMMLLSSVLLFGLVGAISSCGDEPIQEEKENEETSKPGEETTKPDDEKKTIVNGIKLSDLEGNDLETIVADNSDLDIKATVDYTGDDKDARRVTWKSSDENVATVLNGNVSFKTIEGEKPVTITATSKFDTTKSESITFTVKHVTVNLLNSKPSTLDSTEFLTKGVIKQNDATQDTSIMFADIYHTKFYAEAEMRITDTDPSDAWPKFGLMVGTNKKGAWNNREDANGFYYVDEAKNIYNNWNTGAFVGSNSEHTDWVWGGAPNKTTKVIFDQTIKTTQYFKLGILRDGIDYFIYFGSSVNNYETFGCVNSFKWDGIKADEPCYAWVGGWRTAVDAKNFKAITDEAALSAMIKSPTTISFVEEGEQIVAPGDTIILHTKTGPIDSRGKVLYESSDPDKFSVDENGKVKAITTTLGDTATIKAYIEGHPEINATITVKVNFKGVELKGNVTYVSEDDFTIGKSKDDLKKGMNSNMVKLDHKIKSNNFDVTYTISDFEIRTDEDGGNYWPKATFKLNGDMLALGHKTSHNENYVRYESCISNKWHNSNTYDEPLNNEIKMRLEVRDGNLSAYINDTRMVVDFNGKNEENETHYTRLLDQNIFAEKDGYEVSFTSDCCNYKVTNFNITTYVNDVTPKSPTNFVIGPTDGTTKSWGTNKVSFSRAIKSKSFDISYKISNVLISDQSSKWPKAALELNGDAFCLGHKDVGDQHYVRIESKVNNGWSNSNHLDDPTVEDKTFEIKVEVRDLVVTVYLNGQKMKLKSDSDTRTIKENKDGVKIKFTADYMSYEVSDLAILEI